jgi:hypothetical protein
MTTHPFAIPTDDPAASLAVTAALLDSLLAGITEPLHPTLSEVTRLLIGACRALPAGQPAPAGFVEIIDGLLDVFGEQPPWGGGADFAVETAAGNLAYFASGWAHGRPHPDGDSWEKQVGALRGSLGMVAKHSAARPAPGPRGSGGASPPSRT